MLVTRFAQPFALRASGARMERVLVERQLARRFPYTRHESVVARALVLSTVALLEFRDLLWPGAARWPLMARCSASFTAPPRRFTFAPRSSSPTNLGPPRSLRHHAIQPRAVAPGRARAPEQVRPQPAPGVSRQIQVRSVRPTHRWDGASRTLASREAGCPAWTTTSAASATRAHQQRTSRKQPSRSRANGLKLSRKPLRPIPTYQVATTAATPEGHKGSVPQPLQQGCLSDPTLS
jgi:hypothetical protein